MATHQDVPHVLVGALEGAEADGHPEQPLAAPQLGGRDAEGAHRLALAGVHLRKTLTVTGVQTKARLNDAMINTLSNKYLSTMVNRSLT